jgi:hypothetical protein
MDEGGTNPKSGVYEDKLWRLHFDDSSDPRVLGRTKVLEYLTKGTVPPKTAHSFKLWSIKTTLGNTIRTWVVVYDEHSHVQLINKDFYALLTSGHRNKDEEKEKIEGERGIVSTAIVQAKQQAQEDKQLSITSLEEKEQVEAFRNKVREEIKSGEILHEAVKDDYAPHSNIEGFVDSK